ncbi:MAG: nitrate ABC transporter substrate-binding protein, partial [Proteobacteria bacterium]|nr:nitrate ABC transporter substrate-binding protein [Pseudomonadota bacterium]
AAWRAGRLDAIVTYEPTATLIEQAGGHRIYDSRMFPPLVIDVLAVRSEMLHARREDLRALAHAHFRALRHFTRHRLDAAHRLAARMKLTADGVLDTYRGLELPDATQNRELLGGTAPRLAPTLAEVSQLMRELGSLPHADPLAGIVSDVALPPGGLQ